MNSRNISAVVIGYTAFALIAWFDWRLGLAAFLLKWAENISMNERRL